MPKRLNRVYGFGDLHFVTLSCYRRLPPLGQARSRDILVQVLRQVRSEYGFRLVGYVVMPEHIHLSAERRSSWRESAGTGLNDAARPE